MGSRLTVEVLDFVDAAVTMYDGVAEPVWRSFGSLCGELDAAASMAGTDPGGAGWAHTYDHVAQATARATALAVDGSYRLSSLFGQSGRNYAAAEAASGRCRAAVGGLPPDTMIGAAPPLPSAEGGQPLLPRGWHLVDSLVDAVWPDGHQDRLHRAAAAWSASAVALDDAASAARLSLVTFARDDLPEFDDMATVCGAHADHLLDLATAHRALAGACTALAQHIDECHAAVVDELTDLIAWSAGIQAGGAVLSVASFGFAEAPTQAAQFARIAAAAGRITALINRFVASAHTVLAGLPTVKLAVDGVALTMERLQAGRLLVAGMEGVPAARAVTAGGKLARLPAGARAELDAAGRLARPEVVRVEVPPKLRGRALGDRGYWGNDNSLKSHFHRHARSVGARSQDEYVTKSTDLLQRALNGQLPYKVDKLGDIRVFDPATGYFGSYRADGATRTLYREDQAYFDRQPGTLQ